MMKLTSNFIGFCYSSDNFFWDKKSNTFSADVSEVPAVLRQMFNDSMDLGFAMRSSKTGNIVYFSLATAERDPDGDMLLWSFTSSDKLLANVKVIVFND